MTKYQANLEKLAEVKRQEKEEGFNVQILQSLTTKTKSEMLQNLYACLRFPIGVGNILEKAETKAEKGLII